MLRIAVAVVALAAIATGCSQGPLASIWMMDAVQIQHERSERLCNFWSTLTESDRARLDVIGNEIDRRGIVCSANGPVFAEGPPPLVAEPQLPSAQWQAISNVNMRAGPGTGHRILGLLQVGQSVTLLAQQDGWCECMTETGQRVFIACRYLEETALGWASLAGGSLATPSFLEETPYPQVRNALIDQGWTPFSPSRADGCSRGDQRCEGFTETIFCAGTGEATCWYAWRQGERYLLIAGILETPGQLFTALRECSAIRVSDAHPWDWCAAPIRASAVPRVAAEAGSEPAYPGDDQLSRFDVARCVVRLTRELDPPYRVSAREANSQCTEINRRIGELSAAILGTWQLRSNNGFVDTIEFRRDGQAVTTTYSPRTTRTETETRPWAFVNPYNTVGSEVLEFYPYLVGVELSGDSMEIGHQPTSSQNAWVDRWTRVAVVGAASDYIRPVAGTAVSAGFFDPAYRQEENRQHLGIDLPAPSGTPVVAPVSGTVVFNATSSDRGADTAFLVIRETATGVEHVLGHIRSSIQPDTRAASVTRGQSVGTVAEWGRRSHVHWGLNTQGVPRSVQSGPGGNWGWGRAPSAVAEAQAIQRGWIDPFSLPQAGGGQLSDLALGSDAASDHNQLRLTELTSPPSFGSGCLIYLDEARSVLAGALNNEDSFLFIAINGTDFVFDPSPTFLHVESDDGQIAVDVDPVRPIRLSGPFDGVRSFEQVAVRLRWGSREAVETAFMYCSDH